jgi:hypothetical protein
MCTAPPSALSGAFVLAIELPNTQKRALETETNEDNAGRR